MSINQQKLEGSIIGVENGLRGLVKAIGPLDSNVANPVMEDLNKLLEHFTTMKQKLGIERPALVLSQQTETARPLPRREPKTRLELTLEKMEEYRRKGEAELTGGTDGPSRTE